MVQVKLTSGKADFIRRKLKTGKIEQICLCEHNVDFSFACIAQVHGSLLQEVIDNNGKYSKGNIQDYRRQGLIDNRCSYCYAMRNNWGKVIPKTIGEITREKFEEKKPGIVRLGKGTECGHFFYRKDLIDFLKLCKEFGTRVVMPTKMLDFDEDIIGLLRETNSVINYSICRDLSEVGAVTQGFTNQWRIRQAERYAEAGVNTTLTITCDVTQSIGENVGRGFSVGEALKAQEGMTVRLLPLRLNSKKLCYDITGKEWGEIIQPSIKYGSVFNFGWRFSRRGNNEADPLFFHPDFEKLVDSGVGVCGRVGEFEYCDKCHVEDGIRIKFPKSEIVPVVYSGNKLKYHKRKIHIK